MMSVAVGRALRGLFVALILLVTIVTTAGAVAAPPDGGKPAERTPLADITKTQDPEIPKQTWQVDGRGRFQDTVAVSVPTFHGITPQLTLAYDSSAGNDWAGVGWHLGGVSRIERAGAGRGAAR